MIIFLDVQQKKIKIYSDGGLQTIPFDKAILLQQIVGDKEVLYITNAVKTTGNEVFKTVVKMLSSGSSAVSAQNSSVTSKVVKNTQSEPMFMRAKKSNIIIQDIDLRLNGPYDFIPLNKIFEKYGKNILKEHSLINKLIQQGIIELVTLSEVQYYHKQQAEKQSQKDKQLDSILVNDSVKDYVGSGATSSDGEGHDAVEIDLEKGSSFGGGGSSVSNEGSLLPEDF